MSKVVIVRGGLVGLFAACELLERGCSVIILEKSHNLGGNASKAITGIAAPGSELQKANGVADSGADLVAAKHLQRDGAARLQGRGLAVELGCKDGMVFRIPSHSTRQSPTNSWDQRSLSRSCSDICRDAPAGEDCQS